MGASRTVRVAIKGETSGFTLEDLRYLVEQAAGLPDSEIVSLHYDAGATGAGAQFDRGSAELSISRRA